MAGNNPIGTTSPPEPTKPIPPPVRGGPSDMEVSQGATTKGANSNTTIALIMAKFGYDRIQAETLLESANEGNATAIKLLASGGIEPFASFVNSSNTGGGGTGGGTGGGGAPWTPADDAQLQRILLGNRQVTALFDPNYPDGAWIPLPDGTMRLNGTEITIDTRQKGQYKPVDGAPGYLVDPISGQIIDLNGNQIARQQLQEVVRSNMANENLSKYSTDLSAELGRGKLALDTELGVTGLNLDAASRENEQKLKNILETEGLNLESFLGTGNLNIGATNAETGRLNALTTRSSAGGQLANDLQKLQDARTMAVIDLMANPNDFVQREYASRALNAPAGYTGPAFRDNPNSQQFIDQLASTPDVNGLLPTYTAPTFQPVVLPNSSLPRATAPAPQPQAQLQAPVGSAPASQQQASDYFRNVTDAEGNKIPDWALTPLGYAEGTEGTKERQFVTGDPQADGGPNPELNIVHNPGPNTKVEVKPLRDMASQGMMETNMEPKNESGGLGKLLATVLIEISNQWGQDGGPAKYAYGTDYAPPNVSRDTSNKSMGMDREFPNNISSISNNLTNRDNTRLPEQFQTAMGGQNRPTDYLPNNNTNWTMPSSFNWPDMWSQILQKYPKFKENFHWLGQNSPQTGQNFPRPNQGGASINPRMDEGGLSYFAYGTDYGSVPGNPNINAQGGYAGPRDSAGNPLGSITTYDDSAIRNLPGVQYALGNMPATEYNTLNTGKVQGAFGTKLPDVGGLNYQQLLNLQQDPSSWGMLSSLYNSANRDLMGIFNRVRARAPLGQITQPSLIRTGG